MKIAVITSVLHVSKKNQYFGYAPYIKEMNLWFEQTDDVTIVAPLFENDITEIYLAYDHKKINFKSVYRCSFTTFKNTCKSLFYIPFILWTIFKVMYEADHIHLRCPSNMGLLACFVQIFFPFKMKTAKYAGNWDPKSKQPWSYNLQKSILSNVFITKKMKVLVYGDWPNQTANIKSFFTATYSEQDKKELKFKQLTGRIVFLFVGTLSEGKRPLFAIKLVEMIKNRGFDVFLELYGEGSERDKLEHYVLKNKIEHYVFLKGNNKNEVIQKAYENSHFLILPSKSEGWPKVVAEAMFWGCFPIVTKVSCVPYMLDNEKQGTFLTLDLNKDVQTIIDILQDEELYLKKTQRAINWSRKYTIELFKIKIQQLLKN